MVWHLYPCRNYELTVYTAKLPPSLKAKETLNPQSVGSKRLTNVEQLAKALGGGGADREVLSFHSNRPSLGSKYIKGTLRPHTQVLLNTGSLEISEREERGGCMRLGEEGRVGWVH